MLRWGGLRIVALPGEPFSVTARRTAELVPGECLVIGYADGSPGYLPPAEEFPYGGYEIDEAHRYYGMPAPSRQAPPSPSPSWRPTCPDSCDHLHYAMQPCEPRE